MSLYKFIENDPESVINEVLNDLTLSTTETLYPGDERRIFGEALAAVLIDERSKINDQTRQRFLRFARGVVLDYLGEYLSVTRMAPSPSYAEFRFTVSAPQPTNIIIPAGTRITADGQLYFATDANAVLQAGETSVDVMATCQTTGSATNGLAVGTVKTLVDLIPYIQSVENITESVGGDDGEPYTTEGDNRFRNRIQLAPATRTTAGPKASYEYYALSADPDIIDVKVDCPEETPTIVNIYTLMEGGNLPDEDVLKKVEAACSDDKVRPMTDKVTAMVPTQIDYDIEIKYYAPIADEADIINTVEGEGGAIDQYIKWQYSKLGRDINPDKLRSYILSPGDGKTGADRLDVISPTFTAVADSEVAHWSGKLTINHEVI